MGNFLSEVFESLRRDKIILVPTVEEAEGIFGKLDYEDWKYGIIKADLGKNQIFVIGVSKTNAAFASSLIFDAFQPSSAILTGICGAYRDSGLSTGDVVCVTKDYFVDEALYLNGEIKFIGEEGFAVCDNHEVLSKSAKGLNDAVGNTVSMLSSSDELANAYVLKTGASVETMEGAAVALSAKKMGVELVHIRAVSNFCGDRANQEWNVKKAFAGLKRYFEK